MKRNNRVPFVFCFTHCGPDLYISSQQEQLICVIFFQDEARQDARKVNYFCCPESFLFSG